MGTPHYYLRADLRVVSRRRAALAIAVTAGLYAVLVGAVLEPRTFFSGDPGVKYLQAAALVQAHWRGLAVTDGGGALDPDGRFSVLAGNQFQRRATDAPYYGAYSELFTVPVSLCLALFGVRGLYIVPVVAGLGTLLLTYGLAARTAPRLAWLAPLLVGICSPMLFYSVDLWEHSLSALLTTASVWLLASAVSTTGVRRFLFAGVFLGLAIAVREELYGMLAAGLVALAWVERQRRLPAAVAAAAGVLLALGSHFALKVMEAGKPARSSVLRLLQVAHLVSSGGQAPSGGLPAIELIVPLSAVWISVLALAVLVRWGLSRVAAPWRRALGVTLALVVAGWACADAVLLVRRWLRPDALLQAYPVALFLLSLPTMSGPANAARREIRLILTIAFVFAAVLCIAAPFGSHTVPPGGSQWGPRLLLPVVPLLTVGIVFALEHRRAWSVGSAPLGGLILATFAVLGLASLAVQAQGVRELRVAKAQYERLDAATEAVTPGAVIVTDLWWYPAVTAAVLREHAVLAVNGPNTGSLAELLARLHDRGITALTFVTAGAPVASDAAALAEGGWNETTRRSVLLWLEVWFVAYQRQPADATR